MPPVTNFRNTTSSSSATTSIDTMTLRMNPLGFQLGLSGAAAAGTSDHQHVLSRDRHGETDLPSAAAVFALILAELRLLPALAAIAGEIDPRYARIAAKRDAARKRRRASPQRIARLDIRDEGPWNMRLIDTILTPVSASLTLA
jgi:hypothetical protein